MSLVKEAHREYPISSKRWRLVLDCGHFATVIVGHVPALGGRYNCGLCAASQAPCADRGKP